MTELYRYILEEFPSAFLNNPFARGLLENILTESEKIESIAERCDYLARMIPEVNISEIRDILLR